MKGRYAAVVADSKGTTELEKGTAVAVEESSTSRVRMRHRVGKVSAFPATTPQNPKRYEGHRSNAKHNAGGYRNEDY